MFGVIFFLDQKIFEKLFIPTIMRSRIINTHHLLAHTLTIAQDAARHKHTNFDPGQSSTSNIPEKNNQSSVHLNKV